MKRGSEYAILDQIHGRGAANIMVSVDKLEVETFVTSELDQISSKYGRANIDWRPGSFGCKVGVEPLNFIPCYSSAVTRSNA